MLKTLPGRATAEITTFSDVIVVYKFLGDLMFYVTGAQDENELILYQVLQGFYESISLLLRCAPLARRRLTVVCLRLSDRLAGNQTCHRRVDLLCCLSHPHMKER